MIFKHILMCRPKYFDVIHYKLNNHMIMKNKVVRNEALNQWYNLYDNIMKCDVKIDFIKPKKNLVDMVFVANAGLIYDEKAIISNFNAIPRKNESKHYDNYFKKNYYEVFNSPIEFEGAGDALFSHNRRHLWMAHGFRSDKNAKYFVSNILCDNNLDIHSLKLVDPFWYHLDTCFCPIGINNIMLYEKAFDKESLDKIYGVFGEKNCIKVSEEDARNFACNSVSLKSNPFTDYTLATIIGNKFTKDLKMKLQNLNYKVVECDMSQFLLSGGSVKCCILDIEKSFKYYPYYYSSIINNVPDTKNNDENLKSMLFGPKLVYN